MQLNASTAAVTFGRVEVRDSDFGIFSPAGGSVNVLDSTFEVGEGALYHLGSTTLTATNVSIAAGWTGITLGSSSSAQLSQVTVVGARTAVRALSGTSVDIDNSLIFATVTAVDASASGGSTGGTVTVENSLVGSISGFNVSGDAQTQFYVSAAGVIETTLADNGGPVRTFALADGSAAQDFGDDSLVPAGVTTDARGEDRFFGTVDAGALESRTIVVTTLTDEDDGDIDPANGTGTSLREAIDFANAEGQVDIVFDPDLLTPAGQQTITLGSPLTVSSEFTINGPGAGELALEGGRAFDDLVQIAAAGDLTVRDLTLTGAGDDAVQLNASTAALTVERVEVRDSSYGVYSPSGGSVTVLDSTFEVGMDALLHTGTTLTATNVSIAAGGTGISLNGSSSAQLSQVTVAGAQTAVRAFSDSSVDIDNSLIFATGTAVDGSAPIGTTGGTVTIENSLVGSISGFNVSGDAQTQFFVSAAGVIETTLADNGGSVRTFALVTDSPAFDFGDDALIPSGVTTDARGLDRTFGTVDAGAFESQVELVAPTAILTAAPAVASTAADAVFTFTFDEDMDQSVMPVVSFPVEDPSAAFSFDGSASGWQSATEYRAVYNVSAAGVDLIGVDVRLTGAEDLAGNVVNPLDEMDAFDLDSTLPTATLFTGDPVVDAGDTTLTLTAVFGEDMDQSVLPVFSFPAEDPSGVLTLNAGASGWTSATEYEAVYDVSGSLELDDIDVLLASATDTAGNVMNATTTADLFDIDTVLPTVTIATGDALVTTADSTLTLTASFSEDMDQSVLPVFSFPAEDPSGVLTLNAGASGWTSATEYEAVYAVSGSLDLRDVDVQLAAAQDAAGNAIAAATTADLFGIDTLLPTATLTASVATVTEADNTLTLNASFSEDMDAAAVPVFSFPAEDPSSVLTLDTAASGWTDASTYEAVFTVSGDLDLADVDVQIADAADLAGNALTAATTADLFDIDTVAPIALTLSPSDLLLTLIDSELTISVGFDGPMDTASVPTLSFPAEDPSGSLTATGGSWTDPQTYAFTFDVSGSLELDGLDIAVAGGTDLDGNVALARTFTDVLSIDRVAPTITGVSSSRDLVNLADRSPLTITVDFSEALDTASIPVLTLPADQQGLVESIGSEFTDDDTLTLTITFTPDLAAQPGAIDLGGTFGGLADVAGNAFGATTLTVPVTIDTIAPSLPTLAASLSEVTESDTTQTLTFTFAQAMDTATLPTLALASGDGDANAGLAVSSLNWTDPQTLVAELAVTDADQVLRAVDVSLTGFADAAGNPADGQFAGTFAVDTVGGEFEMTRVTGGVLQFVRVAADGSTTVIRSVDSGNPDAFVTHVGDDVFTFFGGQWTIDTAAGRSEVAFGAEDDQAFVADWNGDGQSDLIVYGVRNGQSTFEVDFGTAGGFDGVADGSVAFGIPGDEIFVGDYDGDGSADLVVLRNGITSGSGVPFMQFFVDTDRDGGAADTEVWYGLPGDVPLLVDADGDGTLDPTVLRFVDTADGPQARLFFDTARDGNSAESEIWLDDFAPGTRLTGLSRLLRGVDLTDAALATADLL